MVLDTSAIVATIAKESDAARFQNAMLGTTALVISAVTALETKIVLHSRHGELAKARGEPLLFKGSDFEKTDVQPAV